MVQVSQRWFGTDGSAGKHNHIYAVFKNESKYSIFFSFVTFSLNQILLIFSIWQTPSRDVYGWNHIHFPKNTCPFVHSVLVFSHQCVPSCNIRIRLSAHTEEDLRSERRLLTFSLCSSPWYLLKRSQGTLFILMIFVRTSKAQATLERQEKSLFNF